MRLIRAGVNLIGTRANVRLLRCMPQTRRFAQLRRGQAVTCPNAIISCLTGNAQAGVATLRVWRRSSAATTPMVFSLFTMASEAIAGARTASRPFECSACGDVLLTQIFVTGLGGQSKFFPAPDFDESIGQLVHHGGVVDWARREPQPFGAARHGRVIDRLN